MNLRYWMYLGLKTKDMKEKKCLYCQSITIVKSVEKDYYCEECGSHFEDATKYKTGTFIMGRCTVIITKNKNDFWQMVITCLNNAPSYKEVIQARYKYLPDDIVMAQMFTPRKDFEIIPSNSHLLVQIVNNAE